MTTFLDTGVVVGIIKPGDKFHSWSKNQLYLCKVNGPAIIADIVYPE